MISSFPPLALLVVALTLWPRYRFTLNMRLPRELPDIGVTTLDLCGCKLQLCDLRPFPNLEVRFMLLLFVLFLL
jgi:hypothetical protein